MGARRGAKGVEERSAGGGAEDGEKGGAGQKVK